MKYRKSRTSDVPRVHMSEVMCRPNYCSQQHLKSCSIGVWKESSSSQCQHLLQTPLSVANTKGPLIVTSKSLLKDDPRNSILSNLPASWSLPAMYNLYVPKYPQETPWKASWELQWGNSMALESFCMLFMNIVNFRVHFPVPYQGRWWIWFWQPLKSIEEEDTQRDWRSPKLERSWEKCS